ncbi:MAG TPA: 3'(2'),5'-bisphosphate nucleotidase CysQ [Egibacteraceae bacterium]|nr:3'(2'),5'-bisphosphate nucleotidase CysQ [Egibacteraceae bacterium]
MTGGLDDHRLAAELARRAGEALLELRAEAERDPGRRWTLRDDGDLLAHRLLMDALRQARPGDAVLSEEGRDHPARLTAERVWIVDPLDGTREYGDPPRDDWAVHVALWSATAGDLVAGAVALPARGVVLSTAEASAPLRQAPPAPRLLVSRSRPHPLVTHVIAPAVDGVLVPMGSAGAKAMAVVLGEAEVYAHAGGQYEWDSAAPVAVARAAGLHASRLDGSPLVYNREDPYLPDLLICRPELADRVLAALAAA